jgi:hypothetical protein
MSSSNGKHPTASLAQRFFERFAGLPRAHGHFRPDGIERERDGKQEGFTEMIHAPVTVDLWQGHLDGVYGVGMVPITDDGTCRWGAIDIDIEHKPDILKVANEVTRLELPLITCRSKSGGVHLYLFMSEDAPASLVRGKLMEWAIALGYSGVEVFPKEIRLAGSRDYGHWINLPYFMGDATVRYAITTDGTKLDAEAFLKLAEALAVSISELEDIGMPTDMTFGDKLAEAPPCLQCIAGKGGAGSGSRNKMLFNIGIYLRKRHGDDWEGELDGYNCAPFVEEPLGHKELGNVVKSVNRKNYQFTCNEPPIAQVCSRQICLTRKFGIGGGEDDPGVVFGSLVKLNTAPPLWIWAVDGARLELTTEQLKDQGRFHTTCIDILNKWPRWMKPNSWATLIREKLEHVEVIDVPPDARPDGQMWAYLQQYCTGRAQAKNRDELLSDKPWTATAADEERYGDQVASGRTYFRAGHFKAFLEQQRMSGVTERKLFAWLRERGMEHHEFNLKGRFINCWSIPAFRLQDEAFEVPRLAQDDM